MVESTARAQLSEASSTGAAFFEWTVPGKPVVVRIPYSLMDRLEREAVESFRSLTSRGSEIGGFLLGDASPGTPAVVTLEDYRPVACDYARGPLYRLSEPDLARFERALEELNSQRSSRVVGFFRSHTRKGLSLDADDVAFFQARFREPHQIALLVRPAASKTSAAGIFIREDGAFRGELSYREFPFRSSECRAAQPSDPDSPPAAAARPTQGVSGGGRAQIVPIASRRATGDKDIAEPVPAPAPEPAVSETPAKVGPTPAAESAPKPVAEAKPPAVEKPAPTNAPEPVPDFVESAAAEDWRTGKWVWAAAALALVLIVCTALFFYPGFLNRSSRPAPEIARQSPQDASPLSLRVERTGGGLVLTWNRAAPAIDSATRAVLSISDGSRQETYNMGLEELRKGSIVYMPYTQDISFRMEVTGRDQAKTTSELVRVLRTSPMPDGQPQNQPELASGSPSSPAAETPSAPSSSNWAQPVKPFSTATLSQRLRPALPAELPEAPALEGSVTQAPAALPAGVFSTPSAPSAPAAPARATAPVPSGGDTAASPARRTSQITPVQLLSRRDPVYPALARKNGVAGEVRLRAIVGTDGRVKSIKVVSGHPLLRTAAEDAVRQWIYRPTLLNGSPTESETEIVLNFRAQ